MSLFGPEAALQYPPFEVHGWMDAPTSYYFSALPMPLLWIAFLAPLIAATVLRNPRWAIYYGGLAGLTALTKLEIFGIPFVANLSTYGWLLISSLPFFVWAEWQRSGASRREKTVLLILLAVMGVMVALGFPRMLICNASVCKSNFLNMETAVTLYRMEHPDRLPQMADLSPQYLKTEPHCQRWAGTGDYVLTFTEGDRLQIQCKGQLHQRMQDFGDGRYLEPRVTPTPTP